MLHLQAQNARDYSTFRLPATLHKITVISSLDQLKVYHPTKLPLVLGEGSNSIFLTDYQQEILRFTAANIEKFEHEENLLLHVEAGHNWHDLVMAVVEEGWWGIENLALIPGSVGAAPVQNIGAYGVEFADSCAYVDFYHWQQRVVIRLSKEECQFSYRDSVFKRALAGQGVIVAVGIVLSRQGKPIVHYKGLENITPNSDAKTVAMAVITLRQSKLPDPKLLANCGSFFKNPTISERHFSELTTQWPMIPHYPQPNQHVKIAAAWLIEQAGFKGSRVGGIGCYDKQPLVLVNFGSGTAQELMTMISQITKQVQSKFNISLEPEVQLLTNLRAETDEHKAQP